MHAHWQLEMRLSFKLSAMSKPGRRRIFAACAAALATVAYLAAATNGATLATRAVASTKVDAYVTYYGWYDNTPPGCQTAYAGCVSGTGTYKNPITFASDLHEFPVGTIVYYPTVQKYFQMRDDCSECDADWAGKGPDGGPHMYHLDLWLGGRGANEADVIRCEDAMTQTLPNGAPLETPVVLNPPADLPTSEQPLFNTQTGGCYGGARSPIYYGRYENKLTRQCLAAGGGGATSPALAAPCSSAANEEVAYDGAYLTVGQRCLATSGRSYGSSLEFVKCSGRPRQLWEMGIGGTIAWIQYLECVSEQSGRIELSSCKRSAANPGNEWTFVSEVRPRG